MGGLGLDRHPELRDDYFGLTAGRVAGAAASPELERAAARAAARMGCRWRYERCGSTGLERELEQIIGGVYAQAG